MSELPRAVVLLSSGLDSTVNLYAALEQYDVVLVLTFNYGQRAALQELAHSELIAQRLGIRHKVLDLTWFRDFNASSLIQTNQKIPTSQVSIDDQEISEQTAKSVWVPNRNGIFLNIAAGFAESLQAEFVIPGFNAEEAATFPDNSTTFMKTLDESFRFSTANGVRVSCLTDHLSKTEIVGLAIQLDVPFELMWPCYFAGDKWCGECESCQRSKRAMKANGLKIENYFAKDHA